MKNDATYVARKCGRMNKGHWNRGTFVLVETIDRGSSTSPSGPVRVQGALTYEEWCRRH
jgi:hypothetical protein